MTEAPHNPLAVAEHHAGGAAELAGLLHLAKTKLSHDAVQQIEIQLKNPERALLAVNTLRTVHRSELTREHAKILHAMKSEKDPATLAQLKNHQARILSFIRNQRR